MDKPTSVSVEYCGSWGYDKHFFELQALIKGEFPNVHVSGFVGRLGSYEVSINDTLIYSKIETQTFPNVKHVMNAIMNASEGKDIHPM